jgi:hypothetical protein
MLDIIRQWESVCLLKIQKAKEKGHIAIWLYVLYVRIATITIFPCQWESLHNL